MLLPVAVDIQKRAQVKELSPYERTRFSRHLLLPEVGSAGQLALRHAKVLIVGMGGLGSPVSLYLAAAGVGTLGLVDFDDVDVSNLQRQILYGEADIGSPKLAAAVSRLSQLNSATQLVRHDEQLRPERAAGIVAAYDLVVDGSDNFATRYLLSDICVAQQKPYVYGSILRFAGQASVFYAPHGPCYRCLFPRPPAAGQVPSCAEGGVLGVLPGQIGTIQATETLKLLLGIGEPLLGRLLTLDALTMRFAEYRLARDPACPACGEHADLALLAQTTYFACKEAAMNDLEITQADYYQMRSQSKPHLLVDVREPNEAAVCRIDGSRLIPLAQLAEQMASLPRDVPMVVHCKAGGRSLRAVQLLQSHGFSDARSLSGGILGWAEAYEPAMARY